MTKQLRTGRLRASKDAELAFRAGQWVKAALLDDVKAEAWCSRNSLPIQRALGGSVNIAGGFLVPDELNAAIVDARETYGTFRANANVVRMGSDVSYVPRRTGQITVSFLQENVAATETQASVDNVGLVAKKLSALIRASSELVEDTIALGDFLTYELAYALARKEDDLGWNGSGLQVDVGIRGITTLLQDGAHAGGVAAASGHDTFLEVDATDLGNLIARLPAVASDNSKWYVSSFGFGQVFCRLAASAGGFVTMNGETTFMGWPVEIANVLPNSGASQLNKAMLLLGDLSLSSILGDRRTITLRSSEERYADTDQVGFLGSERIDIVNANLGDATTPGPVVALIGG